MLLSEGLHGCSFPTSTTSFLRAVTELFYLPVPCSYQGLVNSMCSVNVCWRNIVNGWLSRWKHLRVSVCCNVKCIQINLVQTAYTGQSNFPNVSILEIWSAFRISRESFFFFLSKLVITNLSLLIWSKSPGSRSLVACHRSLYLGLFYKHCGSFKSMALCLYLPSYPL